MGSSSQTLPSKETNLFKLIVKSYETKQYKKGLKAADQILKKFSDHGETLAMKGLTLSCLDRKEEAYELVRRGLKNDLRSHVCWHVYGLLYRSDREYREATKCYRNALRQDPGNSQILRDLSLLQAQLRDRAGFVETRRQLLGLKPNNRNNWIALALAQHLSNSPLVASQILTAYEGTLEEPPESERYEHSEMLLYKAMLLDEADRPEEALQHLEDHASIIVDQESLQEHKASLLLKLKRNKEAETVLRELLESNPNNYNYLRGLENCIGCSRRSEAPSPPSASTSPSALSPSALTSGQIQTLTDLYQELAISYPKSDAIKRIPLDFLQGDAFYSAVDAYIRPYIKKGIPSLFSDLRPLYDQPGKANALDTLFHKFEHSLRTQGVFPTHPDSSSCEPLEEESPTSLLWTLFLLAQHYDRRRQYDLALARIDEAITHTPTVIDFYLVKGRILKHVGDPPAAAALADEARQMDLADRFINSECVKRMVQADEVEAAEKTAALFTKDGDQHNTLYEMQCMWYELANGHSQLRQKHYGKALKNFLAVEKHYLDMIEDQFDFHTYCLRKMTLRAYVNMLRMEDGLHRFAFFHRGAAGAIQSYLDLFDSPPKEETPEEEDPEWAALSPAERKRLRSKQRRAELKAKKAEEARREEQAATAAAATGGGGKEKGGGAKKGVVAKPVDPDPDGEKLVQVEDPLQEACKYLQLLQEHSKESPETHRLAFEVYLRRGRLLLALRALKRLLRLAPENADTHRCLIRLFHTVDGLPPPDSPSTTLVHDVTAAERGQLSSLAGHTLLSCNDSFLSHHHTSLSHQSVGAEMLYLLDPGQKQRAIDLIVNCQIKAAVGNGRLAAGVCEWDLPLCCSVHRLLETTFQDREAAERWRDRVVPLFPYSVYLKGPKSSAVVGIPKPLTAEEKGGSNGPLANGLGQASSHLAGLLAND